MPSHVSFEVFCLQRVARKQDQKCKTTTALKHEGARKNHVEPRSWWGELSQNAARTCFSLSGERGSWLNVSKFLLMEHVNLNPEDSFKGTKKAAENTDMSISYRMDNKSGKKLLLFKPTPRKAKKREHSWRFSLRI